jgi:hypothetical protein
MRIAAVIVMLLALGCSDDDETEIVPPPAPRCAPGEWARDDGVCVAAGLPPDLPCPPAEWLRDDGVCIPAGVPQDGCGEGFVHDGDRGCEAILPEGPCPPGLMAVPGERTCRAIATCAAGRWGDIPVEPDTEYVDASYSGTDSDGSALKPWTTLQAAVDAASSGAIVAIAQGSYVEDVKVSDKPVRLWGVCPTLVEVVGTGVALGALRVFPGADGTEVRALSIRGGAMGFFMDGALDVLVDRVRVHDNAWRGINVDNSLGPTGATLRASLLEQNHEAGIFTSGSEVTVETSVIRFTQLNGRGLVGRGMSVQQQPFTGVPSTLLLRASVLEQNHEIAVFLEGSEATVENSVVRTTQPDGLGLLGNGLDVESHPINDAASTLLLRTSLVEQNHSIGVLNEGSEVTVENSVVRDTQADVQRHLGLGVATREHAKTGAPSTLLLRASLVDQNADVGVFVRASVATVEKSMVRGGGVGVMTTNAAGARSSMSIRDSLIDHSGALGILVDGSDATVETSVVRDTVPDVEGMFGRGVSAQSSPTNVPSTLLMRAVLIEQSHEAALSVIDSEAIVETCAVRDTVPNPGWGGGHGVIVFTKRVAASATITRTHIHQGALAAIAAWAAHVRLSDSALSCHTFDLNTESYMGTLAEIEDLGGNACGCPNATASCRAVSTGLLPPQSLELPP